MKKQISSWIFYFNPRSHKGSDIYGSPHGQAHINFNPRSHKGSDGNTSGNTSGNTISIHAPTRGATDAIMSTLTKLFQFQSTLPQGERRSSMHSGSTQTYFNPRSHKGSDYTLKNGGYYISISIHAPTRGATALSEVSNISLPIFQSTLPQGERRQRNYCYSHRVYFNPRSHKGSDLKVCACALLLHEFQSTLPQGERPRFSKCKSPCAYFNPRSHKGSDIIISLG